MRQALLLFVFATSIAVRSPGQTVAPPEISQAVDHNLNASIQGDPLGCEINEIKPFLDFEFRFSAGYYVECPIKIFGGKPDLINVFTRVTPSGKRPLVLRDGLKIPGYDELEERHIDLRRVHSTVEFSGMFLAGEGDYAVDVLLVDQNQRIAQKHWTFTAERKRGEGSVEPALPSNTAAPLHLDIWANSGPRTTGRVTILLNAAPVNPRSLKLRSGDRALLLQWVNSLLKELNPSSVRLVAFNLDQQRELFRKEKFVGADVNELDRQIRAMELGTVEYKTYVNEKGWAGLLANLIKSENTASESSDAVIFVGPHSRFSDKMPKELRASMAGSGKQPRYFYLAFHPTLRASAEYGDAIHWAVNDRDGSTLRVHNPGELAKQITRLKTELQPQQEARAR